MLKHPAVLAESWRYTTSLKDEGTYASHPSDVTDNASLWLHAQNHDYPLPKHISKGSNRRGEI